MKRPGIIDGIVFALLVAIGAGAASLVFGAFVGYGTLAGIIVPASTLAYLLFLLRRSRLRVGRVTLLAAWAAASLAPLWLDFTLLQQVLLQAGFVWLARALYFHGSLFVAALDFGLVSLGLAAAAWALLDTGSLAAALWSFFLLQSLFACLPEPARGQAGANGNPAPGDDSFRSAHRAAVDAVRKLTQS